MYVDVIFLDFSVSKKTSNIAFLLFLMYHAYNTMIYVNIPHLLHISDPECIFLTLLGESNKNIKCDSYKNYQI